MKNALSFYYDLHPDTISYMDDKYFLNILIVIMY